MTQLTQEGFPKGIDGVENTGKRYFAYLQNISVGSNLIRISVILKEKPALPCLAKECRGRRSIKPSFDKLKDEIYIMTSKQNDILKIPT